MKPFQYDDRATAIWLGCPVRTRARSVAVGILYGLLLIAGFINPWATSAQSNVTILYATHFEPAEGYQGQYALTGQQGWESEGTGGNGLVTNFFPDLGLQAFLGYYPMAPKYDFLGLQHSLAYAPRAGDAAIVRFSVLMSIVDGVNGAQDDFRWSVYNTRGERLFSLNFDNSNNLISYALDDEQGFIQTGQQYANTNLYELAIYMDLANNRWAATLNDALLVRSLPMTVAGAALEVGSINAVWSLINPAKPGDNYMLFDDYQVAVGDFPWPGPTATVDVKLRLPGGQILFQLLGEPGTTYAVEAALDLEQPQWIPVTTTTTDQFGSVLYMDYAGAGWPTRYYRARFLP